MTKKNQSTADLVGISHFSRNGLQTHDHGEIVYFMVQPTNISVLSETNISIKINHLMQLLSVQPDIEIEKLRELQSDVSMEMTREKLSVDRLTLRQKEGFIACMPCGYNVFGTQFERVLPASSVANCYPFNYSGKTDPNGFYIGKDKFGTNIIVDFDRRADDKTNSNILILGKETEEDFYQRYAECFILQSEEQSIWDNIFSAFGVSFSDEEKQQFNNLYGG